MNIRVWTGIVAMIALPPIAWAQRPLIYPLRSQSPGAQSVDSAYCYWQAKKETGVDIVRQPQRPLRTKPIDFASDAGRGTSEPPLPASAEHAGAASAGTRAGAGASTGASQTMPSAASGTSAASGPSVNAGGASGTKLPPLPPPKPPMTTYWQAYGDCMQSRGYGVR
ncbi:MAG: hypothetical protein QOH33_2043 [Paraburkholderia sp.]|nr:hypothetical protein [Paraburkholderia sp.]